LPRPNRSSGLSTPLASIFSSDSRTLFPEETQAHVEQLLHIANMLFIHNEQDHMVATRSPCRRGRSSLLRRG
jgi:hypothetical protein